MPYDDPEPDDPNMLVGVVLPADRASVEEMAAAFADEFAALGYDEPRLLALFQQPFYAGAHEALQVLGEAAIRDLIHESVAFWSHLRVAVKDVDGSSEQEPQLVQLDEEGPCRR